MESPSSTINEASSVHNPNSNEVGDSRNMSPAKAFWQSFLDYSLRVIRLPYFPIIAIVLGSTILNFLMVLEWSPYKSYIFSDMHGYWDRALQNFSGDEKTMNTWASNAPYYPRLLSDIFTWLNYFQLNQYRLEVILSLNILLSSLATFSLYRIVNIISKSETASLVCAALYGFSYHNLYFNAFLLAEPFGIPIIIFSAWLLLCFKDSYKIAIVGSILAFGVGIRPSNGLLGLPFALYILFSGFSFKDTPWRSMIPVLFPRALRAGAFSLAFFAVIIGVNAENYRVSDGRLANITAHSGYNFFLGQTQAHKIISRFDGLQYGFVPSPVANHPEFGTVNVTVPLYESSTFYKMGWDVLLDNPHLWWDHLLEYDNMFFNNLFPAVPSVWGFNTFFDPVRYVVFIMFLLCGLIFIPLREKDISYAHVALFSSIFFLLSASLYLFTVTTQYFQNFSYAVYVIFAVAAWSSCKHFQKYKKAIAIYIGILILGWLSFNGYRIYSQNVYPEKIYMKVEVNKGNVYRLNQTRNIVQTDEYILDTIEFFQSEGMLHGTLGDLGYKDNFFAELETTIEVKKAGDYRFTFYVDDGYEVTINDKVLFSHRGLKKMDEGQLVADQRLSEGKHHLRVRYFEGGVFSGLMGYYKRKGEDKPRRSKFQPKGGKGHLIGQDSEFTLFHLPEGKKQ